METILHYLDYRNFLRDWFEENKTRNPIISYRYLGNKLGLDASFLVKVLQGQLHISSKSIPRIADFLKLGIKEREYFELLVLFNKSKKAREMQVLFEKLISLRTPDSRIIEADKYEFFSKWHTIAIYELLRFSPFRSNFQELGQKIRPPISAGQAKDTIKLLLRLGLIEKTSRTGRYTAKDLTLSTGEKWMSAAIRKYQKETTELGGAAIDDVPKEDRDISTVTLSLSRATFDAVRERIKSMRHELLEIARNDQDLEAVYQINFQVFPLSNIEKSVGRS